MVNKKKFVASFCRINQGGPVPGVKKTGRKVLVVEYDEPNALGKRDTQVFLLPENAAEEYRRAMGLNLHPELRKETYSLREHGIPADMPKESVCRR